MISADFESWETPAAEFDAVVAFAVVATQHVLPPDGDQFFADVQEDYDAVVPDDPNTKAGAPSHPDAIADLSDEINVSGLFRNIAVRRYLWDVVYNGGGVHRSAEHLLGPPCARRRRAG